ncbi:helix-turn-helix domain-containing protein [Nesterenkonia suensis]
MGRDEAMKAAAHHAVRAKNEVPRSIKSLRKNLGQNRSEVARCLGIDETMVEDIEEGDYELHLGELVEIAVALRARLDITLVPIHDAG